MSDPASDVASAAQPEPVTVSAARNSLNIFTMRLFTLPFTLITSLLATKALGAEGRGIWAFLKLQGQLTLPLVLMGFNASAMYFVSKKRYAVNDIFHTCLTVGLVQGLASALLIGGLWQFELLGETASQISWFVMLPILVALPVQSILLSLTRLAVGDSWFALNNRVQLGTPMITAGMLWALVIFGGLGVLGTVVGILTTNVLILVVVLIAFWRRYHPVMSFNLGYVREAWRYGLKAWVSDVALVTNGRLDMFVLGVAKKSTELGVYDQVVQLTELLWHIPDSLGLVLFNKIALKNDQHEQMGLTERMHRIVLWTMLAGGVLLLLFAPPFLVWFLGPHYENSRATIALLLPGIIAFCSTKVLTKYFSGTGSPHYGSITIGAGTLTALPLYLILIPKWGIYGAAVASSACYIATAIAAIFIYRRLVAPHKPELYQPHLADAQWLKHQARSLRGTKPQA